MERGTAEIEWRPAAGGEARFYLVAYAPEAPDGMVLAESPAVEWPPTGPDSLRALVGAVDALERRATGLGWSPLPSGSAWYAKRFAFDQAAAGPEREPEDRPFGRAPEWPPECRDRCRCEIHWEAGWIESRFKAVAYVPGGRRGRSFAESAGLRWQLMRRPNARSNEHREVLGALTAALQRGGWAPAGAGASWYELRFAWPSGEPPATVLQAQRPEDDAAVMDRVSENGGLARIGSW